MPTNCAVAGCPALFKKNGNISFYSFPRDEECRSKWVNLCKRTQINPSTSRICSRHFGAKAFERNLKYELLGLPIPANQVRFKAGALPTLHLPTTDAATTSLTATMPKPNKRKVREEERNVPVLKYKRNRSILAATTSPTATMPKPNKRQMQEEERDVPVLKHKRNGYEENVEQRQTIPEHTSVTPQLPPPHNVWTDGGLFESIDEVTIKMESYSDNDEEMDTKMMEMEEDIVKVEHDIDEDDGDCMSTLHPPCSTMHQVLQSSDQHDVQMMDSDKSKQDNNRHTNQQPRHEMMATSDSATPHQVIPGPATPHQVIPGPATPHQVIPGPATPHQVIPGPATPHQVIPGPVTPHQVIPGPTNTHGFEWSDGYDFEPDIHPFDKSASGVTPVFPIRKLESELKYFEAFFDNQVMAKITEETNQHHAYLLQHINEEEKSPHSHIKDWKDTSIRELYVFLALVILMSHSLRPTLTDYWKKDKLLGTTSFGKYMSRNRFKALMSTLHFSSNARSHPRDNLWKIRNIVRMLTDRFSHFFVPFRKLVIDESLNLFQGRLVSKLRVPSKQHRLGIRQFMLRDCQTGIILDMLLCTTTNMDSNKNVLGSSGNMVQTLMAPYTGKGHVLYIDSSYSSPELSRFLHTHKIGTCCTVRRTHKSMPPMFIAQKSKPGDYHLQKSKKILAVRWYDEHGMTMLSTIHKGKMTNSGKTNFRTGELILKPDVVVDYSKNMCLVNEADMMISFVECIRKRKKWYLKLFFHLLDITLLNAFNIMLTHRRKNSTSLRAFTYSVAYQLLEKYGEPTSRHPGRPSLQQIALPERLACAAYIQQHHIQSLPPTRSDFAANRRRKQRNCYVCMHTTRRQKKRLCTPYECKECHIALCPGECFMQYHLLQNL